MKEQRTVKSVYLAGKISKNDWRHDATDLRGAWGSDGSDPDPTWPTGHALMNGAFEYTGPFFMGCDHGPGTHGCGEDHVGVEFAYPAPGRAGVLRLCLDAIRRSDIVFVWLDDPTAYGSLVELGYAKALGKEIIVAAPELPGTFRWRKEKALVQVGHDPACVNTRTRCTCGVAGNNIREVEISQKPLPSDPFSAPGCDEFLESPESPTAELWFAFSCADRVIKAGTPQDALRELSPRPRLDSPIEEAFWDAHTRAGLPGLEGLVTQHTVQAGESRYRLDFALPDKKIAIEADGYGFHSSREAFTSDRSRQRILESQGWRFIRFSGSEINANADLCVRQAAHLIKVWSAS